MSKELDDAYFRSNQCTYYEPLLSKLVDCVDLLEERIKGLLGANVYVGDTDTLPAGSEATVSASKHGYDTMLEFGIPRGKDGSDATATDVRIAGKSITSDGVADIPLSKYNTPGVCGIGTGLLVSKTGTVSILSPNNEEVTERRQNMAVTCEKIDYAVKAAMCDGKGAAWTTDEQSAARERMNAADANKVYIMQKQIENLQGIAATEETDTTEAYTKTVPTGAQKWASLDKVGGKTIVWNQLVNNFRSGTTSGAGLTFANNGDGSFTINGTVGDGDLFHWLARIDVVHVGRKYAILGSSKNVRLYLKGYNNQQSANGEACIMSVIENTSDMYFYCRYDFGAVINNEIVRPQLIDLTQMFGAGNEPTSLDDPRIAFIKAYAEEHPEYNPGELMSAEVVEVESKGTFPIPQSVRDMCPGYGWSAGTVCNEIDFERKVYVQRVGSVDLGTLNWEYSKSIERYNASDLFGAKGKPQPSELSNMSCAKLLPTTIDAISVVGSPDGIAINERGLVRASYSALSDAEAFKAAMQGVILYYELAEPIEVDLSDVLPDDHYIEVEAGGTVTFKQAETQLPVPSSVTYQISTSEVIANA